MDSTSRRQERAIGAGQTRTGGRDSRRKSSRIQSRAARMVHTKTSMAAGRRTDDLRNGRQSPKGMQQNAKKS